MTSLPNHRSDAPDPTSSSTASVDPSERYDRPQLVDFGPLKHIIQGNSWKGIDSYGELDPQQLE